MLKIGNKISKYNYKTYKIIFDINNNFKKMK